MARRKSAIEHLESGRAPHIVTMIPPGAPGYREANGGAMVVSSPAEVDAVVRLIGKGEVATLDDVRAYIAAKHAVAVACPVSTAIFANMGARAAEERRALGGAKGDLTPWWRVLRKGGFLNPKLPGGVERQALLLAADGVATAPLRRQLAVLDYAERRPKAFQ
ncbi:MAG: MGMT family protein [Hyphomonadaceae bacterium]|nr:MGMT family protein [Hyphomonadaceae bacterium]